MFCHTRVDTPDANRDFDRLLRPHLERLYRFAFRLTGSGEDADDLLQEVLLKVYGQLASLAALEGPAAWLCRVMYNHFIDERRRFTRQRLVSIDAGQLPGGSIEDLPGGEDPGKAAEHAEDIIRLDRALSVVSEEHRLVLLLHDVEGYKLKEIQDITGEPMGTIKSRLHRARARLREILAKDATFS